MPQFCSEIQLYFVHWGTNSRNLTRAKEILLIHIITCADTQSAKQTEILVTAGPLTDSIAQDKGLLGKPNADQKVRTEPAASSTQDAPRKEGTPTTLSPAARSLRSAWKAPEILRFLQSSKA